MINLLPIDYKKKIGQEYRWRVLTLGCILIVLAALMADGFLIPSYMLVLTKKSAANAHLTDAEKALGTDTGKDVQSQATALAAKLNVLKGQSSGPSIAGIMGELSSLRVSGVTINNIRIDTTSGVKITLLGQASDRQSLLLFNEALKQAKGVSNVDLPIDQLVKNVDISYQITFDYAQ